MVNVNEFRAQMARHGDTNGMLATALGKSQPTLSSKINGKRNQFFTQPEIQKIIDRYNLTPDEVMTIFFASKVSKTPIS